MASQDSKENIQTLHEEINYMKFMMDNMSRHMSAMSQSLNSGTEVDTYYHTQSCSSTDWQIFTCFCEDVTVDVYVQINGQYNQYRKVNPVMEIVGGGLINLKFDSPMEGYAVVSSAFGNGSAPKQPDVYYNMELTPPEQTLCWETDYKISDNIAEGIENGSLKHPDDNDPCNPCGEIIMVKQQQNSEIEVHAQFEVVEREESTETELYAHHDNVMKGLL